MSDNNADSIRPPSPASLCVHPLDAGWQAYFDGAPRTANPHAASKGHDGWKHRSWERGWDRGQADGWPVTDRQ